MNRDDSAGRVTPFGKSWRIPNNRPKPDQVRKAPSRLPSGESVFDSIAVDGPQLVEEQRTGDEVV